LKNLCQGRLLSQSRNNHNPPTEGLRYAYPLRHEWSNTPGRGMTKCAPPQEDTKDADWSDRPHALLPETRRSTTVTAPNATTLYTQGPGRRVGKRAVDRFSVRTMGDRYTYRPCWTRGTTSSPRTGPGQRAGGKRPRSPSLGPGWHGKFAGPTCWEVPVETGLGVAARPHLPLGHTEDYDAGAQGAGSRSPRAAVVVRLSPNRRRLVRVRARLST